MNVDLNTQAITEMVILQPWATSAPASVLLQVIAVVRLKGLLRSLTVMVVVVTAAVFGLAFAAYSFDHGNLWELVLIMGTPPLFVVTIGLLLMGAVAGPVRET